MASPSALSKADGADQEKGYPHKAHDQARRSISIPIDDDARQDEQTSERTPE